MSRDLVIIMPEEGMEANYCSMTCLKLEEEVLISSLTSIMSRDLWTAPKHKIKH